jgi:hypothetical protein
MWGVVFEDAVFGLNLSRSADEKRREEKKRKGGRVIGWSDKGTVHVWDEEQPQSRQPNSRSCVPVFRFGG